ncbi:PTS sugar transporter subunit IIA [Bacillus methanolicus]|uniref:Mannitol-specific phosphotransferase enzyme IIA component n=1 Tax=Bacillus methanolicus (strain MGA3 / ATCC 53907) TaxID=796606 RepID=I3E3X1_BACMM|nr:PTS sugar transporter subunit IIA [Bacillus methanolicus]AIE58704.1 Mannitol-specific phosphotransferase enzyme IIA component [Bacillus methanolicus MGA3]EIJ81192.1 Phosphotransferase system (PTS) mannitol-specific IIA component [Bacillus methanolicus MGA3]UQD50805.1 PTS mannitol transporter subunit IIA [Bacillus methanolicus]
MALPILSTDNILLNAEIENKESAIRLTGNVLVENGYVDSAYIEKMLEREELSSTYMGNFVAIPHGTEDAKYSVKESGIAIIQVPGGVDFGNGNIVKLLIGIAGKGDEHLEILSKIAIVLSEEENVMKIVNTSSKEEILAIFEGVN